MLNMIAAALAAAQPVPPVPPADTHAQHQQMGHQSGAMKPGTPSAPMQHGMMAGMKDCCCKGMMGKEHQGHSEGHKGRSGR